jgi:hypothetical protein
MISCPVIPTRAEGAVRSLLLRFLPLGARFWPLLPKVGISSPRANGAED